MRVHCRLCWFECEREPGCVGPKGFSVLRCITVRTVRVCTGLSRVLRGIALGLSGFHLHTDRVAVRGTRQVDFHKPSTQQVGVNPYLLRAILRGHNLRWGTSDCADSVQSEVHRLAWFVAPRASSSVDLLVTSGDYDGLDKSGC